MFDRNLANKIDAFIKEKFPVIYEYKFDGLVFLRGGTIRCLMMGIPVKDLDFVILTQGKCQIIDFIRKFKLKYRRNAGGGFKIIYNNFSIDMYSYNDLLDTACYDIDFIFYDLEKHIFISCGAVKAIETRIITEINNQKVPMSSNILRLKKLIKFVKYVTHSNKRVRVKQNRLLFRLRLYKKDIKIMIGKIINNNFRKCFKFLKGCKKEFNLTVLFNILVNLISIVIPFLYGKLIIGIMLKNYKDILIFVLLIACLKIMIIGISYFSLKYSLSVQKKMKYNISSDVSKCVLSCELNSLNNNSEKTFIDKLRNDPNEASEKFGDVRDMLIRNISNFGVILLILYLDYMVGTVFLISILIVIMVKRYNIQKIKRKRGFVKKHISDRDNCIGTFGEMFYFRGNKVRDDNQLILVGDTKIEQIVQNILFIILFLFALLLVKNNLLDVSSFIIILIYGFKLFTLGYEWEQLEYAFLSLSRSCYRIFNLLEGTDYVKEVFGNKYNSKCNGKIEFDNVKFRYNFNNNYVLDSCFFSVKSNEILAIVGNHGSGKTTVLNLISRLYNVDDGCIKIDGVNIDEYSERYIRENVAIVSQNPYLFDMSIKDNLRIVNENITDEELEDVCKLVCLDEFIKSLPKGYNTIIGEGGVKLSGCQKQRLGIARALIKNIKIILLDDLDNDDMETKEMIMNITKGHTIIIVTHELPIVRSCSRILVLDSGKIVGDGNYKELIKNSEVYNSLNIVK